MMLSGCSIAHKGEHPMPLVLFGRQRRQTGHTNRWQLGLPPPGDLLGQAQLNRAAGTAGISVHTFHRTTRSADTRLQSDDAPTRDWSFLPPVEPARLCTVPDCSPRSADPEHHFYIISQQVVPNAPPDAVLECFGSLWELHYPYLCKSNTLSELYMRTKKQRDTSSHIKGESPAGIRSVLRGRGGRRTIRSSLKNATLLQLPIRDPSITRESLSFALRTLYRPNECPDQWGEAVLATANLLGLPQLFQRCLNEMTSSISFSTVSEFHRVSCKYKQVNLQQACERWLEMFLVTDLSSQISLRDLIFDLLLKTLQSPRVFACDEYDLLRTVLNWIYLQSNSSQHTFPSHSTIITFFSRSSRVFLEEPLGQMFALLFQALHLHGITERQHIEEMQKNKVLPQSWLLLTFSKIFYSIHTGGDMRVTDFSKQAVRFGMIITEDHCTRTIGLYGFYFLLQASRVGGSEVFEFSVERLRHWDPVLTEHCRTSQPFSMRPERPACYQINVQSYEHGEYNELSSDVIRHVFGLSKRCSRSQVFQVHGFMLPMCVTFALAFPPS
ncbi:BTB/POZ domain-containing protein 16 isoform X2 [Trichomycterus rosablanca]|uniref:BTB/POZ domain-containing protein 16 isoform X2 n=1 Tax=Trichomycterus rosablanca TaxID=2290929 RepID=UPI002F3589F6